jgi:hypothetical protein
LQSPLVFGFVVPHFLQDQCIIIILLMFYWAMPENFRYSSFSFRRLAKSPSITLAE